MTDSNKNANVPPVAFTIEEYGQLDMPDQHKLMIEMLEALRRWEKWNRDDKTKFLSLGYRKIQRRAVETATRKTITKVEKVMGYTTVWPDTKEPEKGEGNEG